MTEREAIAQLKRGHIAGLRVLVERHQLKAVRAALLVTRDKALAEEVVQDAFLQAYEHIEQFDDGRPFEPWFLRIVINGALRALRRRKFEAPLRTLWSGVDGVRAMSERDPASMVARHEGIRRVQEALAALTSKQRAAIVLRYYLDMSGAEMADVLQISERAVKARLTGARRHLQTLLKPDADEVR